METLRRVERLDAIRSLTDPTRMNILRRMMLESKTISVLGAELDKHPAWIRHHVKALEEAGLIRLVEQRTTRNYTEKFYRATALAYSISMLVRPAIGEGSPVVALASHDFALDLLEVNEATAGTLAVGIAGSLDALIGVRQGLADIAGCHLLDPETGEYNDGYVRHIFPDRDVVTVTLSEREQGLIVRKGNPLDLRGVADIAERQARFVNRNRGSGTRIWLDRALKAAGISQEAIIGWDNEVHTHSAAAHCVVSGTAEVALGVRAAAEEADLDFMPLFEERYDLVIPEDVYATDKVTRLLEVLNSRSFRRSVRGLPGYHPAHTGDERRFSM